MTVRAMQPERAAATPIDELRKRFARYGQEHVLRFWERLDTAGRERLAAQAASLDLEALARVHRRTRELASPGARRLEPAPIERLPRHGGDAGARRRARERGEALLAAGRVAALVVAGGQGTRLGFDGPKGLFPIGPVTGRTLFEIQAQRLRRLRARYGAPVPWYVMTSPATDGETRTFFQEHGFFQLPREDVVFFCQETIPALDAEGRLLLERPDRIVESPNGHGGCFTAVAAGGALADMERRGVGTVFYYQVDNPLVRIANPELLGFHAEQDAQMSCTVVAKRDPHEKMGVVARIDGRVGIVEYTELDDAHRLARNQHGELLYWAGSVAIHALQVDFMRRIAAAAEQLLPYHASLKKIPTVDDEGRTVAPEQPNGYKLERFLFDALPHAAHVAVMEAERAEEYSPVKNAEGNDSPETARRDLSACYRRWLEAAGVGVPEGARLEIDHSVIDGEDDARESGMQTLEEARGVRIAREGR